MLVGIEIAEVGPVGEELTHYRKVGSGACEAWWNDILYDSVGGEDEILRWRGYCLLFGGQQTHGKVGARRKVPTPRPQC